MKAQVEQHETLNLNSLPLALNAECDICHQPHDKDALTTCGLCDLSFCRNCSCPCPIVDNGFGWDHAWAEGLGSDLAGWAD